MGSEDDPLATPSRAEIHQELNLACETFHALLRDATAAELRRRTDGTRWNNRQLLFHMLFGYLIVRRLLPLVRFFGRQHGRVSQTFATVLNSATKPFHVVNYLGSWGGGTVLTRRRMHLMMDHSIKALQHHLTVETEAALQRQMHFPLGWDPFFQETMTLQDVYHYGTQHFNYHRSQLTFTEARGDRGEGSAANR
jgi:DinB superfamily